MAWFLAHFFPCLHRFVERFLRLMLSFNWLNVFSFLLFYLFIVFVYIFALHHPHQCDILVLDRRFFDMMNYWQNSCEILTICWFISFVLWTAYQLALFLSFRTFNQVKVYEKLYRVFFHFIFFRCKTSSE